MTRLGRIIFGEGPHFPTMSLSSFSGKKPQRTMTRGRKLSMRLQIGKEINDQRKSPVTKQKDGKQTQIREENCSYILSSTRATTGRRREHVLDDGTEHAQNFVHRGRSFYLKHTKVCSCFSTIIMSRSKWPRDYERVPSVHEVDPKDFVAFTKARHQWVRDR